MRSLTLDGVQLTDDGDCYVIAEIGHNHQGDVEKCKALFRAAKECGVDAVKLQKRDNRALYTRAMYDKPYDNENSFGATYGEHREALEFGRDEYVELQRYCRELGLTFFATVFDIPSADFLADLDMPAYKIASGDLKTTPLLRHVASLGKPMILSTGGATMDDVVRAYDTVDADQSSALLPPVHRRVPRLRRGAEPQRHPDLPAAIPGTSSWDSPTTRTGSPWRSRPTCWARV